METKFFENLFREAFQNLRLSHSLYFYILRCKTISRELPLRNHRRVHRAAASISNSCQKCSKKKKIRVRLPSHTITAKRRNCVARRRVLVVVWYFPSSITFRRVFERVWKCLGVFESVWTCLGVFERVWKRLNVFERVWACFCFLYASAISVELCNFTETRLRCVKKIAKICWMSRYEINVKKKNRKRGGNKISKKRNARIIETALFETAQRSWSWTRRRMTTAKA